jgi:hypothetical protein
VDYKFFETFELVSGYNFFCSGLLNFLRNFIKFLKRLDEECMYFFAIRSEWNQNKRRYICLLNNGARHRK